MLETRRQLLLGFVGAAGFISSITSLAAGVAQHPPARPTPPTASNPVTFGSTPQPASSRVMSPKNKEILKNDLDQLYLLASDLLKEYQETGPNTVLSVAFVKRAEQAEKIAKQVKNLARG